MTHDVFARIRRIRSLDASMGAEEAIGYPHRADRLRPRARGEAQRLFARMEHRISRAMLAVRA